MDIKVHQPQPLPPPPKEFTITLNEEEFRNLALICGRIGGNTDHPIRKIADRIHYSAFAHLSKFNGDPFNEVFSNHLYLVK